MNRTLSCAVALTSVLLSSAACASSNIVAHVLNFGTYGNGNVYLALDQSIDQTGCAMPYLELPASSAAGKLVLTVAAMAVANGTAVEIHTDTCFNGTPSLDPGARTGFVISQPH